MDDTDLPLLWNLPLPNTGRFVEEEITKMAGSSSGSPVGRESPAYRGREQLLGGGPLFQPQLTRR